MPWYKAGTVKTTNNSNAIIGTGTAFIANARTGDAFRGPDGAWYEVTNIASDTALSISPNYQGPTVAAGGYSLAPMQGYVKDLADQVRAIVQQWGATLAGLGPLSNVSIAPIANGGTGSNSAAGARTALGLGTAATANLTSSPEDYGAGKVLQVGALGWNGGNSLAQSASGDANLLGRSGIYLYSNGGQNVPVGVFPHVRLTTASPGYQTQEAISSSPNPRYMMRNQYGGSFSPWVEFYHSGNTTRAADGTLKAI